jgi:tetratricopeptide (TPR) repeat protein
MKKLIRPLFSAYVGYTEEIHLIETKLDVEDIEVTKILVLAHLKAGLLYQKQEDVDDSIEHLTLGLDLTKQWNDDSQDSTMAMITDTLGVLYVSREDYETAKKFFSDSYSIYEKTLGRDHATTADCAFKLADCLEHVGSNLALDFYAESLRVHRLNITDDDERVGKLLFSIGKINFGKEMYIDAANSFDEVRRDFL